MRRLLSMATAAMASITAVTVPAASERDADDASSTQQTAPIRSTAEQRDAVAITVYNQNFGLVREVRTLDLRSGRIALEYLPYGHQCLIVAPGYIERPGDICVDIKRKRIDLLGLPKLGEGLVGAAHCNQEIAIGIVGLRNVRA